jgi:hypothetical protein
MPVTGTVFRLAIWALVVVGAAALPAMAQPLTHHAVRALPRDDRTFQGVANSDNDNEHNCHQYDDNDNELGNNLIKDWLQSFCELEDENDVEISSADQLIEEIIIARQDSKGSPSQEAVDARRAQLRSLVREAIEARRVARAGQETTISLPEGRVALKLFPSLSRDLAITVRLADARELPPTPGPRVGRLAFELRAQLPDGTELHTLPAEAHLSALYSDEESSGLDKNRLVLARLNAATGQWEPAPKVAVDPKNNYVAATIIDLGTFIIYQR